MDTEPTEGALSAAEQQALIARIDQQNDVTGIMAAVAADAGSWLGLSVRVGVAEALWAAGYRKFAQTLETAPVDADSIGAGDAVEMHARGIVVEPPAADGSGIVIAWEAPLGALLRKVID